MLWVFRVEIFTCPNCGGARRLLAAIKDPDSIELRQSAPRQAGRVGAAGDVPRATARAGCHSRRRSWRWPGLRRMVGVVGSGRDLARVMVAQGRLRGRCGGVVCLWGGFPAGMPWLLARKLVG